MRLKDSAMSAFYSIMFTGPVDIYKVNRSQFHLLATTN